MRKSHAESWGVAPRPGAGARSRPPSAQRTLDQAPTRGGRRKGAGRKRGARPNVRHVARPPHSKWVPVHVTLRRAKGLPSLRAERLHNLLKAIIRELGRRVGFRIVHYSVQADHVHLIVEAESNTILSSGMRSFAIRVARLVNSRVLRRRRGHVWGDRYHRRDLGTPPEVRNALVYVLGNGAKHGETKAGQIDPCSSGRWFDGWVNPLPPPEEESPTRPPDTWLLRTGWATVFPGFLFPSEVPKAASGHGKVPGAATRCSA
jgi:putative transposase